MCAICSTFICLVIYYLLFCFEISDFEFMRTLEEHSEDYAILRYMSYTTTAASLFCCYASISVCWWGNWLSYAALKKSVSFCNVKQQNTGYYHISNVQVTWNSRIRKEWQLTKINHRENSAGKINYSKTK